MIGTADRFPTERLVLRLAVLEDCGPEYVGWLADPEVNRYLETRFRSNTIEDIRAFVAAQLDDPLSYLLAITVRSGGRHVGNIKIGPVNPHHRYADVSYFIGDRDCWGKGVATEALGSATAIAFERLGLHRCQAGVYAGNVASRRALVKNGYRHEGTFREQLLGENGWEDHLWYGLNVDEWRAGSDRRVHVESEGG